MDVILDYSDDGSKMGVVAHHPSPSENTDSQPINKSNEPK
jgi:hypothetical protein